MKYRNFLDDILGKKSKIKALRYLARHPEGASVREIARNTGLSEPNFSPVLKELEKNGVLTSYRYGTALVFKLNRGHFLVEEAVLPLFEREKNAIADLGKFLESRIKTPFLSMILFGSVARGDERPKSDLDIAFITANADDAGKLEQELTLLNTEVIIRFGNMLSPHITTKHVFIKKYKAGDSLTGNIAKEGEVLSGSFVGELL